MFKTEHTDSLLYLFIVCSFIKYKYTETHIKGFLKSKWKGKIQKLYKASTFLSVFIQMSLYALKLLIIKSSNQLWHVQAITELQSWKFNYI